jgi:uncharacterized protein involved in exopolysaccharide biosynthesis
VGLLEVAGILLRWRQWSLWFPVVLVALTVVAVLLTPRKFTSSANFVPQKSGSQLGRLASLAAQFGVAVPAQSASESAEFYADLLVSREILGRIVTDTLPPLEQGGPPLVVENLLGATGGTPEARHQDAVRRLRRRIGVSTDQKTSVVGVRVTTRSPVVSTTLVQRIIEEVIRFDLHTRQSQASAERAFIEGRLADAKNELRVAEDNLQGFLVRNRDYRNAPALQFQFDRLSRIMTSQQEVVRTLERDYEQARIDEVRNTPRITVIERPTPPARPDSRRGALRVILAGLVGVVIGWPMALIREAMRRARLSPSPDYDFVAGELRQLLPLKRGRTSDR